MDKELDSIFNEGIFDENQPVNGFVPSENHDSTVSENSAEDSDSEVENNSDEPLLSVEQIEEAMKNLKEQEQSNERDMELLCGATMLAEEFSDNERAREVRGLAELAFRLTDDNPELDSVALEALPRLISALESTPYNHIMRDLLSNLILIAARNGEDMDKYKDDAKKLIVLDILLEPDTFRPHRYSEDLKRILSRMFSSEELLGIIEYPVTGHLRRDPVEYTWKWEHIYYDLEDELDKFFKSTKRHMGFCFKFWSKKQELLKKKYGIEWHSPKQMNPRVMFD